MDRAETSLGDHAFLDGGGEAKKLILARDWSSHPLGPPEKWPEALKTALSLILNSPESMILAWGPDLHFFFNETYFPLLGPRLAWAMGARFDEVWADGWEQAKPIIDAAMAGRPERFVNLPWKLATDRGPEDTWWTFSYSRILDRDGAPAGLFIFTNETTDAVVGEAARIASDTRNRQIIDSATDYAIIATDLDGRVTRWNEGARRILGWSEDDMLGELVDRIFTPEDLAEDRPQVEMRCALETGAGTDERWHLRKGGERFWANGQMTPLRDGDGDSVGFVKVLRDQTERRQADVALRASEALARENAERVQLALTAGAIIGTWTWDIPADQFRVDEAFALAFGLDPALGREGLSLAQVVATVHPDDQAGLAAAIEEAIARGGAYAHRYRVRRTDGNFYWIEANGRVDHAPDGTPTTFPGVLLDIEERRAVEQERDRATADLRILNETLEQRVTDRTAELMRAEEQLRQSQKVEAVGQLTGGVAHDFNNLLTVIRGSIDLLRRPDVPEDRRRRYLDAIADTADRATRLTSQLLAFARRQALKPEVFDVAESIHNLQDMVRTLVGSRVRIVVDTEDCPCLVDADRSQFDTAIVNMAVNARDAMGGVGTLTIGVGHSEGMPAVRSHPFVPGDFIRVSLTDTGSGIADDEIDRIFEPFFTTKGVGEGTGLGLSQVFGFAKQSGGDVVVESEVAKGATFTLYLPRSVETIAVVASALDSSSPSAGEGACVLVVEDNVDVGDFATQALAELGYHTVLAIDGASALVEIGSNPDRFDIVFSDVVMPGMSGVELAHEIGKRHPRLPVVLTSGYNAVMAQGGTQGFELLHKPYSLDELSRVLRKVAGRSEAAAEM